LVAPSTRGETTTTTPHTRDTGKSKSTAGSTVCRGTHSSGLLGRARTRVHGREGEHMREGGRGQGGVRARGPHTPVRGQEARLAHGRPRILTLRVQCHEVVSQPCQSTRLISTILDAEGSSRQPVLDSWDRRKRERERVQRTSANECLATSTGATCTRSSRDHDQGWRLALLLQAGPTLVGWEVAGFGSASHVHPTATATHSSVVAEVLRVVVRVARGVVKRPSDVGGGGVQAGKARRVQRS
jgi:hypothetical protein